MNLGKEERHGAEFLLLKESTVEGISGGNVEKLKVVEDLDRTTSLDSNNVVVDPWGVDDGGDDEKGARSEEALALLLA
uniref:Uncharacterized protein n=1 Tax=Cannabis sativa TaxID=3483 RepID=A0A803QHJ9_CANSA